MLLLRKYLFIVFCIVSGFFSTQGIMAQSCVPGDPPTTVNLSCGISCTNLSFKIPDLRQSSDFVILPIPFKPYAFTTSAPAISFTGGSVWPGNSYSSLIDLGFKVCFFDSLFDKMAIGANGVVTFDRRKALGWCEPRLVDSRGAHPIPSLQYAQAIIAGAMHDLDPLDTTRISPNAKVEFRIEGSFPCRRAIISYNEIPLWPGTAGGCQTHINTHQIVIYEASGLIDIYVKDKDPCLTHMEGRAILGIENWARNKAVTPRDYNCTVWGSNGMDTAFRFVPFGGSSRLISAGLYMDGTVQVATGNVAPGVPGELIVTFDSICPPFSANFYVMKALYSPCNMADAVVEILDTVYINRTGELNATAVVTPAACLSNTGVITINIPTGAGTPPYNYSINGGPPQTSNVFNNLPPGDYTIEVHDAANCFSVLTVTVGQVNGLSVTATTTNTSCTGINNGTITIIPSNGMPPYQYSLNGAPFQSNPVFTGLAPGTYSITVIDAAGCSSPDMQVTVLPGSPLSATVVVQNTRCNGGSDGSLMVNISNGVPPYQYSMDGVNYQGSNIFTGLPAGSYTVYFRDNNNCSGTQVVEIIEPSPLVLSIVDEPASCFGENDGRITINVTGGSPLYLYSLDGINFQFPNFFIVPAGNYTVHVKDNNGCIQTGNIIVNQPQALQASVNTQNASCGGGADGRIIVNVTGGTATYEYSLDGTNFQASNILNAQPGNYTVIIRDANDCSVSVSAVVGLNNTLAIALPVDTSVCEKQSVQLNAVSSATQYSWSPTSGLSDPLTSNPIVTPSATTTYIVTAVLGPCTGKDTITVRVLPAPIPSAGTDGNICYGESYQLQGSGGLQYQWIPSSDLNDPHIANPVASPLQTTSYFLHVTDGNGCRSTLPDTVTVGVEPPVPVRISSDTIVSSGDIVPLHASGGVAYLWAPPTGLSDPAIADPVAIITQPITYTVEVTSANGCTGTDTVNIKVYKGPDIYVPTGFTPNSDGRNDIFKPVYVGIKELKYFRVYNRWGQLVFSTSAMNAGWDGKIGGIEQATSSFVWMVEGITKEDKIITLRGTVTLIR